MSLVPALLQAIVSLDGEALVIHSGEKPYVRAPSGQVPIATRAFGVDAVLGILEQLLPPESQQALDELGAIRHELPGRPEHPQEGFTVVASRTGDDVWAEVRRRRIPDEDRLPDDLFAPAAPGRSGPSGPDGELALPTAAQLWPESKIEQAAPPASGAASPPAASDEPGRDRPAVVVPLARTPVRATPPAAPNPAGALDRLLRLAAARGASTLYLVSQSRPALRVDGAILALESEPPLAPGEIESLLLEVMPERSREEMRRGADTEWICEVPEAGRVRCTSFRDHRGAGGIFRLMPSRAVSAAQLGLSPEIQALAAEPEGLVLVTGPRASGKSTLVSAFVDLINRSRREHVITIESEIKVVHERRLSLVSQREVRGSADEMLAVARTALRENPDVLVIEELRTPDLMTVALDAAGSGHLVIAAIPAHTVTGAVDRIIDAYPPEHRRQVQLALSENLRGIVAQVLVPRAGGGRVAAREVLLNTPAVASAIADGKTSLVPLALESGRKHGMVPLNDALAALVESGAVEARDAYRRSADRAGLLAALGRHGLDTSFVERLA